jgi:hypothetical protein
VAVGIRLTIQSTASRSAGPVTRVGGASANRPDRFSHGALADMAKVRLHAGTVAMEHCVALVRLGGALERLAAGPPAHLGRCHRTTNLDPVGGTSLVDAHASTSAEMLG